MILMKIKGICLGKVNPDLGGGTHIFEFRQVYVARLPMPNGGLRLEDGVGIQNTGDQCTPRIHYYGGCWS